MGADQVTVITGGAGGIGVAVCRRFFDHTLIVIDKKAPEIGEETPSSNVPHANQVHFVDADVSDAVNIKAACGDVLKITRRIDNLVNCAGFTQDAPLGLLSMEALHRQMSVNFTAAVQFSQFAARLMTRRGVGSIVNVSSITAEDGNVGQLAYGASKAALVNATTTLSMELGPLGIRINAVAPGVIDTSMTQELPSDKRDTLVRRIGLGRLGTPDEVASVIHWLCSERASYVTGQTIRIDGCM